MTRRPWVWWAFGAAGVLITAALVTFAIGPEQAPQPETAPAECGKELSPLDPEESDVSLMAWGEAEHHVVDGPSVQEHREAIEGLAAAQGYEPVAEIPAETLDDDYVLGLEAEASSDEVAVMSFSDSDRFQVVGVDLASGEADWGLSVEHPLSGGAQLHNHGEHLVLAHAVPPSETAESTFAVELVSVELSSGEQAACERFGADSDHFSYHVSSDNTGLLRTRDHMVGAENTYGQTLRHISLPDLSSQFSSYFPNQEHVDGRTGPPGRWQAMSAIDEDVYIAYAYHFYGDALIAAGSADYDFLGGTVPVRAFSVESGEKLWELGEPGDQIAFISTVPNAVDGDPGLLAAEIGEFESTDEGDEGSSPVTLQMYDLHGDLMWELPAQESQDFTGGDLAVLNDLILTQIASDEVTAVDAGTGEELWSADVTNGDDYPLSLEEVRVFGDSLFMPGFEVRYLIDPATGEHHNPAAEDSLREAGVHDITPLGEDHLILHSGSFGETIVRTK